MSFALVLSHEGPEVVPADELAALRSVLADVPALEEALIFTPATATDLYVDDGAAPPLVVQLHFGRLERLEAAAGRKGALQALSSALPSQAGARATAQAFWRREYPVDDNVLQTPPGALPCSYVVHYPGPARDLNAWLDHYMTGHPPLFRRFPGIRGIEILTRVDWVSHLPHAKADHMQRNRVMFDGPEALTAALQSPVRHELRADFHSFPPFEGGNAHYPMWTEHLRP
ncbi:MAG: hypothetical protein HLUCCA12_14425 [Rhodobacteraceae bacterium HLUCCA12]|nr:MAG: hypothetical protein HLUCCA12_14425 [Rhodobacteraceae bacterium HLUCCA12]